MRTGTRRLRALQECFHAYNAYIRETLLVNRFVTPGARAVMISRSITIGLSSGEAIFPRQNESHKNHQNCRSLKPKPLAYSVDIGRNVDFQSDLFVAVDLQREAWVQGCLTVLCRPLPPILPSLLFFSFFDSLASAGRRLHLLSISSPHRHGTIASLKRRHATLSVIAQSQMGDLLTS